MPSRTNNDCPPTTSSLPLSITVPPEIVIENSLVYSGEREEATLSCIIHGETPPDVSISRCEQQCRAAASHQRWRRSQAQKAERMRAGEETKIKLMGVEEKFKQLTLMPVSVCPAGGLVQGHDANPANGPAQHGCERRQALVNYPQRHTDRFRELLMRRLQPARQGAPHCDADRPPASRCLSIALREPVARQV